MGSERLNPDEDLRTGSIDALLLEVERHQYVRARQQDRDQIETACPTTVAAIHLAAGAAVSRSPPGDRRSLC